ncbi:MAG: threonine synthase, partial [Streptosporangiaceae bacterium]
MSSLATPVQGARTSAGSGGTPGRAGSASTPSTPSTASFGYATALTCRECGASFDLGGQHACAECFGPLEVSYDLPALTRRDIEAGPANIWRYASLLPVRPDIASRPNTEPGRTRLIRADNLARALGMRRLWVKDERSNPTHSFKDRVVAVALAAALEMGYRVLACTSPGNLANAVAAAAAKARIESAVLVP